MRADEAAVAALDAEVGIPDRDQLGDVALLVRRRAARVRAVDRQRADRQLVAASGHHRRGHGAHELGRVRRARPVADSRADVTRSGSSTLCRPSSARSTAAWLRSHHLGAAPAVGLLDRRLDPLDRLLALEHARDREEAGLEHRVRAPREARPRGRSARRRSRRARSAWRGSAPGPRAPARPRPDPGGWRQLSSSVAPGAARSSTSGALEQPELVAADEAGLRRRGRAR